MIRILIVAPANLEICPYVKKYLDLFDTLDNVSVDLISWNRYAIKGNFNPSHYHCVNRSLLYLKESKIKISLFKKINHFIGFSKFIIKTYNECKYDKVIFLTSSTVLFLPRDFLKRIDYIFDYRDTSFEWFLPFKLLVNKAIKYSKHNMISSEGFKMVLPKKYEYINIHNIDSNAFVYPNDQSIKNKKMDCPIVISYVGLYTEKKTMLRFLKYFANDGRFLLNVWGYSENKDDEAQLKQYVLKNKITNIFIRGPFNRETKPSIYGATDLLLYFYDSRFRYKFATANKYYDSLFYSVPCLVNGKTVIGKQMDKNKIGCPVDFGKPEDKEKIINYYLELDEHEYMLIRKKIMLNIIDEDRRSNEVIKEFIQKE